MFFINVQLLVSTSYNLYLSPTVQDQVASNYFTTHLPRGGRTRLKRYYNIIDINCMLSIFESLFKRVMGYSKTLRIFGNLFTVMYFLVTVFSFVSPASSSSRDEVLNGSYIFKSNFRGDEG